MNIGDHIEAGLSAVGITSERVSRVLGRQCKCKQRKAALNKLGQRAAAAIRKATGQEQQHGDELDDRTH